MTCPTGSVPLVPGRSRVISSRFKDVSALEPRPAIVVPAAEIALLSALADGLSPPPRVRLEFRDEHINDPSFADATARLNLEMMNTHTDGT